MTLQSKKLMSVLAWSLIVLGIFMSHWADAQPCTFTTTCLDNTNTSTAAQLHIRVFLDGNPQNISNSNELDITGWTTACGSGPDYDGTSHLYVYGCQYDDMLVQVSPGQFSAGATVEKWVLNSTSPGFVNSCEYFAVCEVDSNTDLDIYLLSASIPAPPLRDPVSARWNPDAGRRSGGDLIWGPAYLAAKSRVTDAGSEAYPALLYSGEAF